MEKYRERSGRIDLHLHTTNSDGDNTPEEVIKLAAQEGMRVIALTDHNHFSLTERSTAGVPNPENSEQREMTLIPGCEFSVSYFVPEWNETREIHVVGLFPDGVNPLEFADIFAYIDEGKWRYVRAIVKQLNERGIGVTLKEVEEAGSRARPFGRHRIGDVLIQKGYAKNMDDAFDRHIGNFSPFYIPATRYIRYAPMDRVVRQVQASGGIPILAHPYGYSMNEFQMERLISEFREAAGSTAGMEVFYELYIRNPEKMAFLKDMAEKYNLLASVASDRHRDGQPFASTEGLALYEKMLEALHGEKEREE